MLCPCQSSNFIFFVYESLYRLQASFNRGNRLNIFWCSILNAWGKSVCPKSFLALIDYMFNMHTNRLQYHHNEDVLLHGIHDIGITNNKASIWRTESVSCGMITAFSNNVHLCNTAPERLKLVIFYYAVFTERFRLVKAALYNVGSEWVMRLWGQCRTHVPWASDL